MTTVTVTAADVRHETFTVVRRLSLDRETVFAAFADDRIRRRWLRIPGARASYRHEFGVGGGEDASSTFALPDGRTEQVRNRSRYLDITPGRRVGLRLRGDRRRDHPLDVAGDRVVER